MRKIYSIPEASKLLDQITELAVITHESSTEIAKKLGISEKFIPFLESRNPHPNECYCPDCQV